MKNGFYSTPTILQRLSACAYGKLTESQNRFLSNLAKKHFIKAQLRSDNNLKKNAPSSEQLAVLLDILKDYKKDPLNAKSVVAFFSIYKNAEALSILREMRNDSDFWWQDEVSEAIEKGSKSNVVLSLDGGVMVEPRMGEPSTAPIPRPNLSVEDIIKNRAKLQMKQLELNRGIAKLKKVRAKLDEAKDSIFGLEDSDIDKLAKHLERACEHDSSLKNDADKLYLEVFSAVSKENLKAAFEFYHSYSSPLKPKDGAYWLERAHKTMARANKTIPRALYVQLEENYFETSKKYFLICYKANNMIAADAFLEEMKSIDRKKTNAVEDSASKISIDESTPSRYNRLLVDEN